MAFHSWPAPSTGSLAVSRFLKISAQPMPRWIFTKNPLPSTSVRNVRRASSSRYTSPLSPSTSANGSRPAQRLLNGSASINFI
ncbi:hypothetical protein D3C76_1698700 [compost metagenome]